MMLTSLVLSNFFGKMLAIGSYSVLKPNSVILVPTIAIILTANILLYRFIPDTPVSLIKRKKFTVK